MSFKSHRRVLSTPKGWSVESDRGGSYHLSQAEALHRAREVVAQEGGGEVVHHTADGQILKIQVPPSPEYEWSVKTGESIRRHRKAANLSRKELSELSGIGTTALYQLENGHPTVRLATLLSVLRVLNIKLHLTSSLEGPVE